MFDPALFVRALPDLLKGAAVTLEIAFVSGVLGVALGSLIALAYQSKWLSRLAAVYVTFIRGTPMLVQILFIFYLLPQMGVTLAPFGSAVLAIGLNSAAYVSQVVRSGINGVSKGQIEAARSLGLSKMHTLTQIVLPQACRMTLPALGNEFVTLMKDSSLASVIGVVEMTKQASMIQSRTFDAFTPLVAVSLIYLILTGILTLFLSKAKHHVKA